METKDIGTVTLDKGTKKVKCFKFYNKEIERTLMVHADVDKPIHVSVSDEKTGFRLFGLDVSIDKVKMEQIEERLDTFIKHFTIPLIDAEFKRIENLPERE